MQIENVKLSDQTALKRAAGHSERIRPYCTTHMLHRDGSGNVKGEYVMDNLITNAGHAAANGRMSNQGGYNPFVNIALGTGTTAAAAADTALQTEATTNGAGRGAATATQVTTTVTNDTTQLVKTFTFTGAVAITEEGIFDSATASAGTMLAHQVFAAINVVNADSLTVTHKFST